MACNAMIQLMCSFHARNVPIVPRLISSFVRAIYACDIKPTANIARSAVLVHDGLGCVFHENVVLEEGVRIYQNVTLGGSGKTCPNLEKGHDYPTIKKNAVIYAGACVLGPVTVGESSIVGANAVVLTDVPPNSLAVGVPAVIKPRSPLSTISTNERNN